MSSPVTMSDAIDLAVLYQLGNVHTALPASIVSYQYTQQRASVQPLLNKSWGDGTNQVMPIINDVPVIFPKSGGASLTFPVNPGDTCLLLFIERSTDLWKSEGGQVTPDDGRKFDLSDAVAIMGLFPFSDSTQAINNTDVFLTFKGSYFQIKSSGDIVINTSGTIGIGNSSVALINEILALLQSIITNFGVSSPFPNPAFVADATTIYAALLPINGSIP